MSEYDDIERYVLGWLNNQGPAPSACDLALYLLSHIDDTGAFITDAGHLSQPDDKQIRLVALAAAKGILGAMV